MLDLLPDVCSHASNTGVDLQLHVLSKQSWSLTQKNLHKYLPKYISIDNTLLISAGNSRRATTEIFPASYVKRAEHIVFILFLVFIYFSQLIPGCVNEVTQLCPTNR